MLFNSLEFWIFFPVVTTLYFALPHRFRWLLLLAASCVFYMAFIPAYILILFATIIVDYWAGIFIERAQGEKRKLFLIISIISNVGFLVFFKYYGFLSANVAALAQWLHWNYSLPVLAIILPIGLSFHTFQAMSYTIEVYRGKQVAEHHLGIYALYVMFYPQLVAGPIERPQNLLHQFYEEHRFDYRRVVDGLKLMLWGFFKKIVIADQASIIVDTVYGSPTHFYGLPLIIATVAFAWQIYFDFSGYSDIAIGAARVMGFELMTNFDHPYQARSIGEFWRRWHISLSTWFRDYLYIPLGGNRVPALHWTFNILVVFLVSGLWHGANWTYVAWGALHGGYLLISRWSAPLRIKFVEFIGLRGYPRIHAWLQTSSTFLLVSFAWIFFRANSFATAATIIQNLFTGLTDQLTNLGWLRYQLFVESGLGISKGAFIILTLSLILVEFFSGVPNRTMLSGYLDRFPRLNWVWYSAIVWWILIFGIFVKQNFIYFQF